MNTTDCLEQLAKEAHFNRASEELAAKQSAVLQQAIATSNTSLIHGQFTDTGYLANPNQTISNGSMAYLADANHAVTNTIWAN